MEVFFNEKFFILFSVIKSIQVPLPEGLRPHNSSQCRRGTASRMMTLMADVTHLLHPRPRRFRLRFALLGLLAFKLA
jgi:hypothetical protein